MTEPVAQRVASIDDIAIGPNNRLAVAAALAVAEAPGQAYNPLVIHASTMALVEQASYLLHAIGALANELGTARRIVHVSGDQFPGADVALADLILIDRIDRLPIPAQPAFVVAFDALCQARAQLVLTSDRRPADLTELDRRVRGRLESGLVTDIGAPNRETRLAILRRRAQRDGIVVAPDVLALIASRVTGSIRSLESALASVVDLAQRHGGEVDAALAQAVLSDLAPTTGGEIGIDTIIRVTAHFFGVSVADLKGATRTGQLAHARQVAMYLARELTEASMPRIGRAFGGRDHTTVMHADRKIRALMADHEEVNAQVVELLGQLRRGY